MNQYIVLRVLPPVAHKTLKLNFKIIKDDLLPFSLICFRGEA